MASYEIKLPEYTEAYKRWMELTPEERKETIEPPMYELPDEIKENNNKKCSTENVGSSLPTRYTDNKGKFLFAKTLSQSATLHDGDACKRSYPDCQRE